MNTQRKVFNKLFKEEETELSAQKIELALVDDLKSIIKDVGRIRTSAYAANKEAITLKNNIEPLLKELKRNKQFAKDALVFSKSNNKEVDSAEAKLKSSFKEFEGKANDLGINVNSLPVYKAYKEALNELKQAKEFSKDGESISAKLLSTLI
mgnify:CR=1 FL=1|tara:strand:- start:46 stop:501 length:456 start_codon:yes stop_codon:yes gene_type:complete